MKAALALTLLLSAASIARADDVADFYRGKNIQLYIGYAAGGGYDAYARVLARHLGEHISGHPAIVPQNMPGAGSLRAANYLYAIAPKDGTALATFARGLAVQPLLDPAGIHYDARKFTWIGSIADEVSVCAFRTQSNIRTLDDMRSKSFTVGGSGPGSDPDVLAAMLRNLFRMKMKIVDYAGEKDIGAALERGGIDGRCGWPWSSIEGQGKELYDNGKITVALQFALHKHEDLPNVPLVFDLASDPKVIAAMKLIVSRSAMARPYAAPPGIPPERKDALRAAFDATMRDPAFLEEAKRQDLDVRPVGGDAIDRLIAELYASPADVVAIGQTAVKETQ